MSGGHARSLQYAKSTVTDSRTTDMWLTELLQDLLHHADLRSIPLEGGKLLVASALCSVTVSEDLKIMTNGDGILLNVDQVREYGYCTALHQVGVRYIPVLSPLQLILFLKGYDENIARELQNAICARNEQLLFGGIKFETFHGAFECLQRMFWVDKNLKRQTVVEFKRLYERAGKFSGSFDNDTISLYAMYDILTIERDFLDFFCSDVPLNGMPYPYFANYQT